MGFQYDFGRLLRLLAVFLLGAVVFCLHKGYRVRQKFRSLQRQGIPLIKHSAIFGHLEVVGKLLSRLPPDAHGDYMMVVIMENWQELFPACSRCPPLVYLDLWPFAAPMAISIDPAVSTQFTQDHSLPKAFEQKRVLQPLTLNKDVSSMEGAEWKLWRRRLNPGFSIQNITSRIPDLLEEVEDFVAILKSRAGADGAWGDVFPLEETTTNLAMDVILRFFLNKRFHEQSHKPSVVSVALRDSISRLYFYVHIGNILSYLSPWRHFKLWSNYRAITAALSPILQERVSELQRDHQVTNKTLIDLIVKSLDEEAEEGKNGSAKGEQYKRLPLVCDTDFLQMAIGQLNTFLFAGHDTTAATLCWLFRLLAQHPDVLARLRAEHDAILGPDPDAAAGVLAADPQRLVALVYTAAVLKESMRIHTNVGTMRRGEPGFFLVGPPGSACDGIRLPTDGFIIWDGNFAIHRRPDVWERPGEFLPERFLPDAASSKDTIPPPPKNAWRSFELGPRGCIGQHLAVVEIKLVLTLVARRFDIECAWEEWDAKNRDRSTKKASTIWGDRCYQVGADSPPHVKDGMPVHVRIRR